GCSRAFFLSMDEAAKAPGRLQNENGLSQPKRNPLAFLSKGPFPCCRDISVRASNAASASLWKNNIEPWRASRAFAPKIFFQQGCLGKDEILFWVKKHDTPNKENAPAKLRRCHSPRTRVEREGEERILLHQRTKICKTWLNYEG